MAGLLEPITNQTVLETELGKLSQPLRMIFNKVNMKEVIQANLAEVGFTSVGMFQALAPNEEGIRKACEAYGLKSDDLANVIDIVAMAFAWQECKGIQASET